jgi:predicted amidohydrolase YtcJ
MKTLLHNGKIYLEREKFAKSVLVEDGLIKKVYEEDIEPEIFGNEVDVIECEGHTVIPGLNDSHCHVMQTGETMYQVNIEGVKSIEEMLTRCKDFMKEYPERCEHGIHAIGWNQDYFDNPDKLPDKNDLDKISTDIPIVLERVCGHIVSSNTKAMEIMKVTSDPKQYPDGEVKIGEDGKPNGLFIGNACNFIKQAVPDFTMDQRREMMINTLKYAAELGLTTVQSNDVGTTFMDGEAAFKLFRDMYDSGEGCIRYTHQVCFNDFEAFKKYVTSGELVKYRRGDYGKDSKLTIGPLKLFRDGSLGAETAFMRNGYVKHPDNHGEEWIKEDEMAKYCELARDNGLQVVTHCIGDKAIEGALNCYEKGFIDGENKLRHTIVHCQITDKALLQRIADLGVCVMAQPIFLDYDMMVVESRVGKELASTSYAFKTLKDLGVHVAYGTDSPVESLNPFPNIYMAITRKNKQGEPDGGFYPDECVDVYDAVDAYTLESAYVEFQEDRKGRIKEGYVADMVVLDKDIFTVDPMEIKDMKPVMTMVAGEVVYDGR